MRLGIKTTEYQFELRLQELTLYPCADCKKECLSELLGTYLLVLVGPAAVILVSTVGALQTGAGLVIIGLSFGGTVAAVIMLLGKYSGAHINPAVTVGCAVSKTLPRRFLAPFIFFQITGSLFAGLTLRAVFGSIDPGTSLGSTRLAPQISPVLGIVIEAAGTFSLVLAVLLAANHVDGYVPQGFLVGSTLFLLIVLIGPLTGASFNPARSLGPALVSGYLANQLVYWIGPLFGGLIAAVVFGMIEGYAGARGKRAAHSVCLC